ncbi:MAG TPA: hypothetical protein VGK19_09935 [Capsulimonadaceae bacterium]|jgi:hypothetical protein
MSLRQFTIILAALVGIIAPFLVARRVIDLFFVPDISGAPLPRLATTGIYLVAVALASAVFYYASRAIKVAPPSISALPAGSEELPE